MARKVTSPLRYPGGKQRLVKEIAKYVPRDFSEYREPFVGGGSVYFHLRSLGMANVAWLNDIYSPLAYFWSALSQYPDDVCYTVTHCKEVYADRGKSMFDNLKSALQSTFLHNITKLSASHGGWFFIVNRLSFSGLGMSGGYSQASFEGRFKDSHIDMLKRAAFVLRGAKITCDSYEQSLTQPPLTEHGNVFIYMDPPYDIDSKTLYGTKGDTHKTFDHEKFARDCQACPHKWLITYNDNPKIRELFSFANIHEVRVKYSMNSTAKERTELIITNY